MTGSGRNVRRPAKFKGNELTKSDQKSFRSGVLLWMKEEEENSGGRKRTGGMAWRLLEYGTDAKKRQIWEWLFRDGFDRKL